VLKTIRLHKNILHHEEEQTNNLFQSKRIVQNPSMDLSCNHIGPILIRPDPFQIHFNPIGERIVGSFFPPRYDEDGRLDPILSERVYFYDFAKNFSVFRPVSNSGKVNLANSKEDKVRFLFAFLQSSKTK
jgi:hypothetical protein